MASIFGITAQDVLNKIVPINSQDTFIIGPDGDISEADCLSIVETQEDRVLSSMPDRYRFLMKKVDGEYLTKYATKNQTGLKTSLSPIKADTLKVYVNYPRERAWIDRNHTYALKDDEFTINATTGEITLTVGLNEGDSVLVEYEHEAAKNFLWLKDIAVTFTVVELARRFAFFRNADGFERFDQWEISANVFLRDMSKKQRPTVDAIERIELVSETKPMNYNQIFGW